MSSYGAKGTRTPNHSLKAVPMDEDEGDFRATPLWYAVGRAENFPLIEFLLQRGTRGVAKGIKSQPLLVRH